jgi:hypothetical protein
VSATAGVTSVYPSISDNILRRRERREGQEETSIFRNRAIQLVQKIALAGAKPLQEGLGKVFTRAA